MAMRVRGKWPHGRKEVGGPTLKTFVLGQWVSGTGGPRRLSRRCIRRAKAGARCEIFLRTVCGPLICRESARGEGFSPVWSTPRSMRRRVRFRHTAVAICVGLPAARRAWS